MVKAAANPLQAGVVETGFVLLLFPVALLIVRYAHRIPLRSLKPGWLLATPTRRTMLVIAIALLGRALLFPVLGIPSPIVTDEHAYLLTADTFAHLRLTNATPPGWEHFEAFHVNLQPTYHGTYPVGQGLVLAAGQVLFGQPWFGVYLSTALLCGALCWALQAFVPMGWDVLGGTLAVVQLALVSYWMNSYWGGSVAAIGGAVAMGSVTRVFGEGISNHRRFILSLGFAIGLVVLGNSRPFEGLAFSIPLLVFFVVRFVKYQDSRTVVVLWVLAPLLVAGFMGLAAMAYYDIATTGKPFLMPYVLHMHTYAPNPAFIGQRFGEWPPYRNAAIESLWREIIKRYGYADINSASAVFNKEMSKALTYWWFYVGPALSFPVLLGFIYCLTQERLRVVAYSTLATCCAVAVTIDTEPHYFSVATVAIYILAVEGLRYLWLQHDVYSRAAVIAFAVAAVLATASGNSGASRLKMDLLEHRRAKAEAMRRLAVEPGKHLVLISYAPEHDPGRELVYNGADIADERIIWARSLGAGSDKELCLDYPSRIFWNLTTDDKKTTLQVINICR